MNSIAMNVMKIILLILLSCAGSLYWPMTSVAQEQSLNLDFHGDAHEYVPDEAVITMLEDILASQKVDNSTAENIRAIRRFGFTILLDPYPSEADSFLIKLSLLGLLGEFDFQSIPVGDIFSMEPRISVTNILYNNQAIDECWSFIFFYPSFDLVIGSILVFKKDDINFGIMAPVTVLNCDEIKFNENETGVFPMGYELASDYFVEFSVNDNSIHFTKPTQ